jgi:hypothetical protein
VYCLLPNLQNETYLEVTYSYHLLSKAFKLSVTLYIKWFCTNTSIHTYTFSSSKQIFLNLKQHVWFAHQNSTGFAMNN